MNSFIFTCLVLFPFANLVAAEPEELAESKKQFAELAQPTEADRQDYIIGLAKLRAAFADEDQTESWSAVDAEILRHPAAEHTETYTKLMVGKWSSPRHEYIYRADGGWSMLPEAEGITRGQWRIEGNQFFSKADIETKDPKPYTILLLTKDNFIFTDGKTVFYEERVRD